MLRPVERFSALNWREIEALARDLDPALSGLFFEKIQVPSRPGAVDGFLKSEWLLRVGGKSAQGALLISMRAQRPYLGWFEGKAYSAARGATTSAFDLALGKALKGERVRAVRAHPGDRILLIEFGGELVLALVLIPAAPEAVLFRSSSGEVVVRSRYPDRANFSLPESRAEGVSRSFEVRPSVAGGIAIWTEELTRSIDEEVRLERVREFERLVRAELKQLRERVVQQEAAVTQLKSEPNWQHEGDLLKSSLHLAREMWPKVEVFDWETDRPRILECDFRLTPEQQLTKFYEKSKRTQRKRVDTDERLHANLQRIQKLELALASPPSTTEELIRTTDELRLKPKSVGSAATPGRKDEREYGKSFESKDGLTIVVGRDKDENLDVTFKVARGNDLWLHLKGRPSSHAVVLLPPKKSAPLETLLDAANLIIHYAAGMDWGKTEVDYTARKHVKKIPKSTQVTYAQNKTLMVTPDRTRLSRLLGQHPGLWWVAVVGLSLLGFGSAGTSSAFAEVLEYTKLAPIEIKLSAPETLSADSIRSNPSRKFKHAGQTSVTGEVMEELGLATTVSGGEGGLSQVRGVGRTADDTSVQALGVALNPAQGGGFDQSVFPAFLWDSYRFGAGPSRVSLDPFATAGVLELRPWTTEVVSHRETDSRRFGVAAGSAVQQIWAGAEQGPIALQVGQSFGRIRGTSGSVSSRVRLREGSEVSFDLLATDVTQDSQLPSAPNGKTITSRVIPVLGAEFPLSEAWMWRGQIFGDWLGVRYEDQGVTQTDDRLKRWGLTQAVADLDWTFGLSVQREVYAGLTFSPPTETRIGFSAARIFREGRWLIEPSVSLTPRLTSEGPGWVAKSVLLGARFSSSYDQAIFARVGYSEKLPNLTDRYYVLPGFFAGNPGLLPESVLTVHTGHEWTLGSAETTFEMLLQRKANVQVLSGTSMTNASGATIFSILHRIRLKLTDAFRLSSALTGAWSELDSTGDLLPYLPRISHRLGFGYETESWDWTLGLDSMSERVTSLAGSAAGQLPGVGILGFDLSYHPSPVIKVGGKVENLMDRSFERVRGYPADGRVWRVYLELST